MNSFNKSFFDDKLENDKVIEARKEYITAVYDDM